MKNSERYDKRFYECQKEGSLTSATFILKFILNLFPVRSVVDFGCGIGTWLKICEDEGIEEILGFDANSLPDDLLLIPRNKILILDFEEELPSCKKKFDLAICLECLVHVSEEKAIKVAKRYSTYSDLLLFSAAVPFQDGENHINCQRLSYWTKFFRQEGFSCFDIIRPNLIQGRALVEPWYLQNTLIFAKNDKKQILINKGFNEAIDPVTIYHEDILRHILWKYDKEYDKSLKNEIAKFNSAFASNNEILLQLRTLVEEHNSSQLNFLEIKNAKLEKDLEFLKAQVDLILDRLNLTKRIVFRLKRIFKK